MKHKKSSPVRHLLLFLFYLSERLHVLRVLNSTSIRHQNSYLADTYHTLSGITALTRLVCNIRLHL